MGRVTAGDHVLHNERRCVVMATESAVVMIKDEETEKVNVVAAKDVQLVNEATEEPEVCKHDDIRCFNRTKSFADGDVVLNMYAEDQSVPGYLATIVSSNTVNHDGEVVYGIRVMTSGDSGVDPVVHVRHHEYDVYGNIKSVLQKMPKKEESAGRSESANVAEAEVGIADVAEAAVDAADAAANAAVAASEAATAAAEAAAEVAVAAAEVASTDPVATA